MIYFTKKLMFKKGKTIGKNSVAIGTNTTSYGDYSYSEGFSENKALDITNEEDIESAITDNAFNLLNSWEEDKFTLSANISTHTEGTNCLALGKNSHAEGNGTIADKSSAHAEGTGSRATGKYSHAGGLETTASGQGSFAHGQRVSATGAGAIAFGYNDTDFTDNNATGEKSVTIGRNSKATALESVAIGKYLIADGVNQVVVGKCNVQDSTSIFIVGNGSGSASHNRANAFVIKDDNKAYIKGDVQDSDNEKVLIDKKYLKQYFPIQKILSTTADVNNAKEGGLYRVAFTYNLNGEYTYGELLSIPYKSTDSDKYFGAQLFFANGDYDDGRQNCLWYRTINGTTWNAWIKIDPTTIMKKSNFSYDSNTQTLTITTT